MGCYRGIGETAWLAGNCTPTRSRSTRRWCVRLPRLPGASTQVAREARWLPRLAPHLPLEIPTPLGTGVAGEGYLGTWSIQRWIDGQDATSAPIADPHRAAADLGEFVTALQRIDPAGAPLSGSFSRGVPLAVRDASTRAAIDTLRDLGDHTSDTESLDTDALLAAWQSALDAPVWHGEPVWFHGDLLSGNLLVRQGRLSAVIDFGCLGVGDPACDIMAAWTFVCAANRDTFRAAAQPDDATWARGRGWALSVGLIALPYYRHSNPVFANVARRMIDEVLAGQGHPRKSPPQSIR